MEKFAIFAYVRETNLSDFDNRATAGVHLVARNIINELRKVFHMNYIDLGPLTKGDEITAQLEYAARNLNENGLCFLYFHGHGHSLPGSMYDDEIMDQALVCNDRYLLDDEIDKYLRLFKSNHRIFSIVDSCSSGTVIEWPKYKTHSYPKIIHLGSAKDNTIAYSLPSGGRFSKNVFNLIHNMGYSSFSYKSFANRLKYTSLNSEFCFRYTENNSISDLNSKLFN